jgi:hypothetical protein
LKPSIFFLGVLKSSLGSGIRPTQPIVGYPVRVQRTIGFEEKDFRMNDLAQDMALPTIRCTISSDEVSVGETVTIENVPFLSVPHRGDVFELRGSAGVEAEQAFGATEFEVLAVKHVIETRWFGVESRVCSQTAVIFVRPAYLSRGLSA